MKKLLFTLSLFVSSFGFSQEKILDYTVYSYSEFINTINSSKDSIVSLNKVLLQFDVVKDKKLQQLIGGKNALQRRLEIVDTIFINKELKLSNVYTISNANGFNNNIGFNGILFKKKVTLRNSFLGNLLNCEFKEEMYLYIFDSYLEEVKKLNKILRRKESFIYETTSFYYSIFNNRVSYYNEISKENGIQAGFLDCDFYDKELDKPFSSYFLIRNQNNFWITKSRFHFKNTVLINVAEGKTFELDKNNFNNARGVRLMLQDMNMTTVNISENLFGKNVFLDISPLQNTVNITWPQFSNKIIDFKSQRNYFSFLNKDNKDSVQELKANESIFSERIVNIYNQRARIENEQVYHSEKKMRSQFYNYYKESLNTDYANAVYTEIKDLETARLHYLYRKKPTFNKYFTWKTNQFLKIFSAYGTEPARAVTFSVYVILAFALTYLFFPNSWDSHGKNRIIDRYNFFFTYMKRKAGIHEVYLEGQKEELMSYEQFKENIYNSNQKVPRFFTATALPLYKWAISGTQFSASILKRIDIMKGTWSDLPKSKRIWKSILLISAFLVAILYDITIKTLNALMLSINTFTTLGFGEIPIKGLPRYLAIIQGFIGWFMLTIFSVSLISQLLN